MHTTDIFISQGNIDTAFSFSVYMDLFSLFVFSLFFRCQIASAHKHSKYKHKSTEGSGDGEDDDRSKTFMTEARIL